MAWFAGDEACGDGEQRCGRRCTVGFTGARATGIRAICRGCGVGAAGAADPAGAATTAQDRHAGGDERHPVSAAHRLSLALLAARQLSATLDGLQYLLQVSAR